MDKRRPLRKTTRALVLDRDNSTCQLCGRSAPEVQLEVDHVLPVALGGTDSLDNLRTLCHDCNAGKSDLALTPIRPDVRREPPWFDVSPGSTGQAWHQFEPSWAIRQVRGQDPGIIQWRYRSRFHADTWRTLRTEHFGRANVSTIIDFSKGPTGEDDRLGEMQLGFEIRCQTQRGWRHELHVWPLKRTEHPGNSLAPIHMEPQAEEEWPAVWYEDYR